MHAVIGDPDWRGDETFDPKRSLLSERHPGTLAERVAVPRRNLVPKPAALVLRGGGVPADRLADRLPDAVQPRRASQPGQTVLVQGAGGGVATAAIALGRAAGVRMWATSRDEDKRERALELGADAVFESGARLPERVDVVLETVGEATWSHSVKSLQAGRHGRRLRRHERQAPPAELQPVFFLQLSVVGSTMGTRDELRAPRAAARHLRACAR